MADSIVKAGAPQDQLRALLTSDETFATTLITWVIDSYGTEAVSWTPTTIRMQMAEDWGVDLPSASLDRIMAAICLLTSDAFYQDVATFVHLANVLAGDDFNPNQFSPADVNECAWAVTESMLLSPPESAKEPFSPEIQHYLGEILKEEGFLKPPPILAVAKFDRPQVPADYADDPEMFSTLFQIQSSRTSDVDQMLVGNLQELVGQLQALPLRHGDTTEITKRISQQLQVLKQELSSGD